MMGFWTFIGVLALGWSIGWVHAHISIARECRQLGGFYVGGTTFRCEVRKPGDSTP